MINKNEVIEVYEKLGIVSSNNGQFVLPTKLYSSANRKKTISNNHSSVNEKNCLGIKVLVK